MAKKGIWVHLLIFDHYTAYPRSQKYTASPKDRDGGNCSPAYLIQSLTQQIFVETMNFSSH